MKSEPLTSSASPSCWPRWPALWPRCCWRADGGSSPQRGGRACDGLINGVENGPVHPRTHGEHIAGLATGEVEVGPSPHICRERFAVSRRSARCNAVHPRTCGEHQRAMRLSSAVTGSSPHLRGTPNGSCRAVVRRRFIPAPAGNTSRSHRTLSRRPVHPRTCGEHILAQINTLPQTGPSPHLRGTHPRPDQHPAADRFIPAHTGNTSSRY